MMTREEGMTLMFIDPQVMSASCLAGSFASTARRA